MDASLYPLLFAPLQLGNRRVRNRIAHASITTRLSENRRVSAALLDYYGSRARGGAGLIVTEPLSAARFQNLPHKVRVWSEDAHDGLSRWAEVVEREDCRLLGQLQDAGRGRHERGRNPDAIGVAALADDLSWTVPHPLSVGEIGRMIEDFADSSRRLQRCGFSGVELSAAHGHLFHQFMSPWMNTRDDEYGGDFARRLRLMCELLQAIRQSCGTDFLIGVKMPGDDGVAGSIGPDLAAQIARHLTEHCAIDYLCFAQGAHAASLDMHVPDMNGPRAPYAELTRQLRSVVAPLPVMAVGLITDPPQAEALLAQGVAELIGLGRPLVTDAAWGLKAAAGRDAEIRYCVSCNTCWATITEHRPLACDNNPRVGRPDEADWWPPKVAVRKRIAVVGAGVAGLEVAWIAAARGHEVTVFGAGDEVGGKTRLLARLPGGESLSSIYDYQYGAAKKAQVHFELGVRATVADVSALRPDEVVLASGAFMSWPHGWPMSWHGEGVILDLRTCAAQMLEFAERQGGTAVIFDRDATEGTYAAAELFHRLFDRIVIVTPRDRIADDVPLVTRLGINRRFAHKGIEIVTLAEISGESPLDDAVLNCRNIYTGRISRINDVALLTYSTPRAPDILMLPDLLALTGVCHVVGDAYAPRTTLSATAQGHETGCRI